MLGGVEMVRGDIRRVNEIVCGLCGEQRICPHPAREAAVRYFRQMGWRLSERHGWVCAACRERGRRIALEHRPGR